MHTPFLRWLYRWGPALGLMAAIFALSSLPGTQVEAAYRSTVGALTPAAAPTAAPPAPTTLDWHTAGHVLGFAALGLAFFHGFRGSLENKKAAICAMAAAGMYGVLDEFHQAFTPGRQSALTDALIDAAAAGLAIALAAVTRRLRA